MNRLNREKRAAIVRLRDEGHTVREICREVGVSRETVTNLGIGPYRLRIFKLVQRVWDELEKAGLDPMLHYPPTPWQQAFLDLHYEVGFKCPIHPEANPDNEDVWPDQPCRLCKSDGMMRHHERRQQKSTRPW